MNLTDNILSFMVKVNVDFMIEGMKCHKDDKYDVKSPETEVNKRHIIIFELNSQFVFPMGLLLLFQFSIE